MGSSAESTEALQDLGRVFLLVEVDSEEDVMLVEVQRWRLAGSEKMGNIFHLNKGHGGLFEFDSRGRYGEIDESIWSCDGEYCDLGRAGFVFEADSLAESNAVSQSLEKIWRRQLLA